MQRRRALISVIGLVLGAMFAFGPAMTHAQDGTPAADPLAGVTIETLSSGAVAEPADHTLLLMRMTLAPGAAIPPHRHPGPVAVTIDSGTFGTRFVEGEGQLTRAAVEGTPAATEAMTAGNEYVLNPGDSFFYQGAAHTMENAGDEPVVLLISALFADGQPGFMFMDMSGTPTP
ncbi:MAG: cupin domain-containing protein [Thermomicrobiales bacterium]